jgi:hypothetical protein
VRARWFIRGGGKLYGPLDDVKLRSLVAEGKIDQSTEVAVDPRGPWQPAGQVRGLFPEDGPLPAVRQRPSESPRSPIAATEHATQSVVLVPHLRTTVSDAQDTAGPSSAPLGRTQSATLIAVAVTAGMLVGASLASTFFLVRSRTRPQGDDAHAAAPQPIDATPRPREVSVPDRNRAKYAERTLEFIDELRSVAKLLSQRPSPQTWRKKLDPAIDMETRVPACPEDFRELHQLVREAWAMLRHNGSDLVSTLADTQRLSAFQLERDTSALIAQLSNAVLGKIDGIEADASYARLIQVMEENSRSAASDW